MTRFFSGQGLSTVALLLSWLNPALQRRRRENFQILDSCVDSDRTLGPSSLYIVVVPRSHPVSPLHPISHSEMGCERHDGTAQEFWKGVKTDPLPWSVQAA